MNKATATTITVNTSLFNAGDTLWIHNVGAGVCTITAGTATVSTSGSLALAQNAGGTLYFTSAGVAIFFPTVASSAQGLTLLNTTSFSGVSSFDFATDVFTSTYDRYLIHMYAASSTGARACWRGRTAGSANTTSNYTYQQMIFSAGVVTGGRTTGDNKGKIAYVDGTNPSGLSLYIYQPKNATKTYFRSVGVSTLDNGYQEDYAGAFSLTTSFDSIQILMESGTFTGKASLYGFNE
jgi:hypothetical protein